MHACDPCPQENNLCTMTCSLTVESLNCLHMDLPSQSLHGISRRILALTAQLCMGRIDITYRSLCYYIVGNNEIPGIIIAARGYADTIWMKLGLNASEHDRAAVLNIGDPRKFQN